MRFTYISVFDDNDNPVTAFVVDILTRASMLERVFDEATQSLDYPFLRSLSRGQFNSGHNTRTNHPEDTRRTEYIAGPSHHLRSTIADRSQWLG